MVWWNRWSPVLFAWSSWLVMLAACQTTSAEIGFEYHLNVSVLWLVFGQPDNTYSLRNLLLPTVLAFPLVTAPSILLGLLVYRAFSSERRLFNAQNLLVLIVAIAFLVFMAGVSTMRESLDAPPNPANAVLFGVVLLCVTFLFAWLMDKSLRELNP